MTDTDIITTPLTGKQVAPAPEAAPAPPEGEKAVTPALVLTAEPKPIVEMKAFEQELAALSAKAASANEAYKALTDRIGTFEAALGKLIDVVGQLAPQATAIKSNGTQLHQTKSSWDLGWDK